MTCPTDHWTCQQEVHHAHWTEIMTYKYGRDWAGDDEWVMFLHLTCKLSGMSPQNFARLSSLDNTKYRVYTEKCLGCTEEQYVGIRDLMITGETFETSFKLVVGYE